MLFEISIYAHFASSSEAQFNLDNPNLHTTETYECFFPFLETTPFI